MGRIGGVLLLVGLLAAVSSHGQQARGGVVYSYVKDGKRFYSAKPPPPGSSGIRVIPYTTKPASPIEVHPVYRCPPDSSGQIHYSSRFHAGCLLIAPYRPEAAAPGAAPPKAIPYALAPPISWHGYGCIQDCSGHEAGYRWAERIGIEDPDECGGNSQSFIEGCEAYAEEVQQQMIEDGDCEDADEDERCDN